MLVNTGAPHLFYEGMPSSIPVEPVGDLDPPTLVSMNITPCNNRLPIEPGNLKATCWQIQVPHTCVMKLCHESSVPVETNHRHVGDECPTLVSMYIMAI